VDAVRRTGGGDIAALVGLRSSGREPDEAAVGVFGVLAMPPVVAGLDAGDLGEVVLGRWRWDRPLERAAVSRVVAGDLASLGRTDRVHEEHRTGRRSRTRH
jgi:hypothetical protein